MTNSSATPNPHAMDIATASVSYLGELRTHATHMASQNSLITDAPTDNHGRGEAFSPTDLLATSLASCMLTIMGIKAAQMQVDMTGTTATVVKVMASEPRRVSEIHIDVIWGQTLDDKTCRILEGAARTCPVAKSLHPDIAQVLRFLPA